jgi:hypothetical protein
MHQPGRRIAAAHAGRHAPCTCLSTCCAGAVIFDGAAHDGGGVLGADQLASGWLRDGQVNDLPLFSITDHRARVATEVHWPAQRAAVYVDGRRCTWMYETRNETAQTSATPAVVPFSLACWLRCCFGRREDLGGRLSRRGARCRTPLLRPECRSSQIRIEVGSSIVIEDSFTDADQLVRDLLAQGSELHVDYKTSMAAPSDKRGWAKLVKQVIGFSNHKDGGYLLIGVEDGTLRPIGLSPEQGASWDAAKVNAALASYAGPRPVVQVFRGSLEDGTVLVALHVVPFEEQPLVCTKSVNDEREKPILRAGGLYIRTEGTETREVSTEAEMRELLGRAYVKKADRLLMEIKALIDAHWPGTAPLPAAALFSAIEQDLTEMVWP